MPLAFSIWQLSGTHVKKAPAIKEVTLFASPMGMRLYGKLRFWGSRVSEASLRKVEGEKEIIDTLRMVLESHCDDGLNCDEVVAAQNVCSRWMISVSKCQREEEEDYQVTGKGVGE